MHNFGLQQPKYWKRLKIQTFHWFLSKLPRMFWNIDNFIEEIMKLDLLKMRLRHWLIPWNAHLWFSQPKYWKRLKIQTFHWFLSKLPRIFWNIDNFIEEIMKLDLLKMKIRHQLLIEIPWNPQLGFTQPKYSQILKRSTL